MVFEIEWIEITLLSTFFLSLILLIGVYFFLSFLASNGEASWLGGDTSCASSWSTRDTYGAIPSNPFPYFGGDPCILF